MINYLHKAYFHVKIQHFVTAKSDPDQHWFCTLDHALSLAMDINFDTVTPRTVIGSVLDPDPDPPNPHVFGPPDPDPIVRGMDPDPDPSIIMQK
jgi:hypothetical protein